jgi:integrase/recombinase XerD
MAATERRTAAITAGTTQGLIRTDYRPSGQQPALVYLAQLGPDRRRVMRHALDLIADILTAGECEAETLDWAALRAPHTAHVRAQLLASYRPPTVNVMLTALRGVLKACWDVGQMDAQTYHSTAHLPPVVLAYDPPPWVSGGYS